MLDSVRSILSGKTLFILVTLLAIPFVFFGSTSFGTVFTSYGTVNGELVSQTDVSLAASNVTQRYQAIFGEEFSIDSLGEEQYTESLKQEIINQKILISASKAANLYVSEKQAKKEIIQIENFQKDGVFDESIFQSVVRSNGFTPEEYINLVQETVSMDNLIQGIASGAYLSEDIIKNYITAFEKTRDLEFLHIEFNRIREKQSANDEEIKEFYNSNPLLFLDRERRSIKSLQLSLEDFKDPTVVEEDIIKTAYEEYVAEQQNNVQRKASHIMIDVKNYESKEAALNRIADVQKQISDKTLGFNEAVAKYSEDTATIDQNGDLGFSAGFAFPEEFELALSSLELNQTSNIIDLGDTLHILKLTDLVQTEIRSFDELASELRDEFINDNASQKLQAAIANYEQRILAGENFEIIFDELEYKTYKDYSDLQLSSEFSEAIANEVFSSNKLNNVSFVDEDDQVFFFTVTDITEPELLTFDDAKVIATDDLLDLKTKNEIDLINKDIVENNFDSTNPDYQSFKAVTRYSSLLPREVIARLFNITLQETAQVTLPNGDIYWIKAVTETMPDEDSIKDKEDSYQLVINQLQQQRYNAYLDALLKDNLRVNLKNL
jgi:peptidyl-prolyl cis-trans isomerase D